MDEFPKFKIDKRSIVISGFPKLNFDKGPLTMENSQSLRVDSH